MPRNLKVSVDLIWSMEAMATVYVLTLSETHTYAHVYMQVCYRATACQHENSGDSTGGI